MAGALQSLGYEFLVLLAGAGALAAQDLGMGRHEPADKLGILVVQIIDFAFAKDAGFVVFHRV